MKKLARHASLALVAGGLLIAAGPACSSGFGQTRSADHILVAVTGGPKGSAAQRNPLSFDAASTYMVDLVAQRPDGTTNTDFNGFIRLSSKPGTVTAVTGEGASGRNVKLVNGVASGIAVSVVAAFGDTRIWAEDLGYVPGDPARTPQCANGIDDNGNGVIDFPADPGCAFANDDSEDGGTFTAGVSEVLYFVSPRIADVRGVIQGGTGTSFPFEQVEIDTGWRYESTYAFSTVVTRVASDGFYATDLADNAPGGRGYASVFAFNFSAPPRMRVCDRLKTFGGTSSDFFGFTEVNYPTWTLEEWDPTQRPCLVPEPHVFGVSELDNTNPAALLKQESSLVRVLTGGNVSVHVTKHFGALSPAAPDYVPTDAATNCDLNRDGKVDFATGPEQVCSSNCTADVECTEYSNFASRKAFRLVVTDTQGGGSPIVNSVLADASASSQFDPVAAKGKDIRSFTGTLRYFSGGNQFTIEARCQDDIVTDLNAAPVPSDAACVHARTIGDNNSGSN